MKRVILLLVFILFLSNISALCNENQIDINTANLTELEKIIHVGQTIAGRIIEARPFSSVNDLARVKGIGSNTNLAGIKAEGLACVNEEIVPEENISKEEKIEEVNKEDSALEEITDEEIVKTKEIKLEEIKLNDAKNIKSEDNNENWKKNLALCGIALFCLIFGALFFFRRKYKNEFSEK